MKFKKDITMIYKKKNERIITSDASVTSHRFKSTPVLDFIYKLTRSTNANSCLYVP